MNRVILACLLSTSASLNTTPSLELPPRSPTAQKGTDLARAIAALPLKEREERIFAEVMAGNVPNFLRTLVPVTCIHRNIKAIYHATPDYLAIGSDDDYFLTPLTPFTAQRIADRLGCTLPTAKMVDDIYANAEIHLTPAPIPPSPAMTTVPVFLSHNETVRAQRKGKPLGVLVAGHKKDVVITNKLLPTSGKVAIYGWHKPDGKPIQPLYTGHTAAWVDYSHGIRLVSRRMTVNGEPRTIDEVLADPRLAPVVSEEGVMTGSRYPLKEFPFERPPALPKAAAGETIDVLRIEPGVRIVVDQPAADSLKPVLLIFYALPNGNSIEQTIGKTIQPGDDWHFDIQHIGAQARFLRERIRDRRIVVVYLENDQKSWPAWRKKNGDSGIPAILEAVSGRFRGSRRRIALSGHSGGGSLIFGYLNSVAAIPDEIERIAFLDSNYAYETSLHHDKLLNWLKATESHYLTVLAYDDAAALLDGKPFVTPMGGTWGRSHAMLGDLEKSLSFAKRRGEGIERHTALDGRVTFLLKENPDRKVLHTVQVERNGFIQSLLAGTKDEEIGYTYFGERVYMKFIRGD